MDLINKEKEMELDKIVIINGDKIVRKSQITNFFEEEDLKLEENPLEKQGIGKDFLQEYFRKDIWS